jgi:hypothetical protein
MLKIVPLELKDLNALVARLHRHHRPVQGHRFSIGLEHDGKLVGGISVGRPVARMTDQRCVLEVTRLVTDGTPNTCSLLYAAAARVGKELGYKRIQTFILDNEPGTSLRAAGWSFDRESCGGDWTRVSKPNRRQDQPQGPKHRYSKILNAARSLDETAPAVVSAVQPRGAAPTLQSGINASPYFGAPFEVFDAQGNRVKKEFMAEQILRDPDADLLGE